MPIITDLSPPQTAEGLILGAGGSTPLNLGNAGSLQLSALVIPPPAKRPEWASNGDVDGAELVRIPLHDNRDCSFKVRAMDGTMDQAVAAIKLLEDKLQEACALGANGGAGLAFLWTPAHATVGLTGYMVFAQITDMPITYDDGWFAQHPVLTVAFTAKPFLYGAEVTGPTATGTTPVLTVAVPSVPGDVPAEARLVVTDGSTQARRWVEWGLEQRYYNSGSPSSLLIDSEDLVTSGFAGAQATRTGGYRRAGATHDTVSTTLLAQPMAICGTGNLPHVGMFRIKARIWATSTAEYWRITWQDGDASLGSNDWVQPVVAGFNELDLGVITVQQAATGTQKWAGRIEAYTTTSGGEVGEVDYLKIFPRAEGYGRLEGKYAYASGVINGHDEWVGASGTLNTRTAPAGGAWATAGVTTDFTTTTDPDPPQTATLENRTTNIAETGPRFAILGSSTFTDCEVGLAVEFGNTPLAQKSAFAIARYIDTSNYAFAQIFRITNNSGNLNVGVVVAGTPTTVTLQSAFTIPATLRMTLRLVAFASGRVLAWVFDGFTGATIARGETILTALATGGTLASGKAGFADQSHNTTNTGRWYRSFYMAIPTAEQVVINSGRSLEVRSDSNLRQSSDGTAYGDIASRGSRLFVPQAGDAGRTSRIAVSAAREDIVTSASRNDGDSITLATFFTPRYLAVPR